MSMLDNVKTGKQKPPVLAIFFGAAGVGKTTIASKAPKPIFLGTENGTAFIDVARFPAPKKYEDILQAIKELTTMEHPYLTLVIDSLDWMEPLIWQRVVDDQNTDKIKSLSDIGYNKGPEYALVYWSKIISALTLLRETKKMNIILIAHSHIKKIEDPKTKSAYDRYVMKLHEKASSLWREYVDVMCFATFEIYTSKGKDDKVRAYGGEERVLHTVFSAAYDAKNRMNLPAQLPVDWDAFMEAYNTGCDSLGDPSVLKQEITVLLELAPDEVKPKASESFLKAGDDISQLSAILNRLRTVCAA